MYLVRPVLQYQTTNSQYVVITVIALSTPNKIGVKRARKGEGKHTVEWKFCPKETAAPTTPPRLKIAQKIEMNKPFWLSIIETNPNQSINQSVN